MKICHITHGQLRIPPVGWGAVESLVWDYKFWVEKLGHQFHIVNTPKVKEIVYQVKNLAPDVVHVHCERYFPLADQLDAKVKVICSHWPELYDEKQKDKTKGLMASNAYICCLSDRIREHLSNIGIEPRRLFVAINGARSDLYRFTTKPRYPDRSIYLACIHERKRQYLVEDMDFIDFVGPKQSQGFDYSRRTYKGEWLKEQVYSHLTDYSSLILLSTREASPLATREALMAGLGLVVSEGASVDLDGSLPFIAIIPEEKLGDHEYVSEIVRKNQQTAINMRDEIHRYGVSHFDWRPLVEQYIKKLEFFLNGLIE